MDPNLPGADVSGTENSTPAATAPETAPVIESAPAASGVEAPSTPATAAPSAEDAQPAVDEDVYWAWVEKQDPAKLLKRHRALQGKVGELSDKAYRERRQKEIEEEARQKDIDDAKAKEKELDEALENDPYKATDIIKEQRALRKRVEEANGHRLAMLGEWDARLERMFHALPDEVKKSLSGKQYSGEDAYGARIAFLQDIIEGMSETKSTQKLGKALKDEKAKWEKDWEKGRAPAIRQDALGDLHRDGPSPDTDGGVSAPGELNWEDFQRNRGNPTWRRDNRDRIDSLLARQHRSGATKRA